jgi:hypothetical protein
MTTYLEDFERGSLGTLAPNGATYTNNSGWTIVSGQGICPSGENFLVYDHGLTDPTIEADVTMVASQTYNLILRYVDSGNYIACSLGHASLSFVVYKYESSSYSVIEYYPSIPIENPSILRVDSVGDYFTFYEDDTYIGDATTSFLSGNTVSGIGGYGSPELAFNSFTISSGGDVPPEEPSPSGTESTGEGWGFIPIF